MKVHTQLTNKENQKRTNVKLQSALAITFALMLVVASSAYAQQSAGVLFQSGLYQEQVKGDLDAAIKVYERIIINFPKNRPVVAKALLHIGLCYEKLGKQEAQKAYQRVIRGYADQHEVVAEAKTRLSRLTRLESAVQAEDIVIRKFMDASGAGFHGGGEPSPNGKYFCFVDWEKYPNDIVIKEIGTGEEIRLRNQIDLNYEGDVGTPYFPTWSPDSKKIAYTWESDEGLYIELRVIEIDNPKPDVLIRVSYFKGWVTAADWSPDGQHILVLLSENDQDQLGLISIVDSSFHLLKKFDYFEPTSAKFSPDGHHIAYDLPPNKESTNHDIYVLSIDGRREIKLTSHPSHDYLLDWSPTGKKILFASDRTGTKDVWSISFDEGAPQGEPKLITENIGLINPLGCTRNGSFYFSTPGSWWDIYTVTIDPETGKIVESPAEVPLPYQGYNKHPALSPNGKYLAYISMRGHLQPPRDDILCIYTIETGKVQEFDHDISIPRWFPDSQSILVNDTHVLKIDTGEITPFIQEKEGQAVYSPSIPPDKKYLYYVRGDKNSEINSIISRDLKTGKEKELYHTPDDSITTALSPDGKQLALLSRHKENTRILKILSTMNGSEKDIHKFKLKEYRYISTAWSPDGRYIYFSKRTDSEDKWGLWRIPATGGTAENLGVKMQGFASLSIHPDGRRITFASLVGLEKSGGIWVMENFLPEEKVAHKPNFRKIWIPTKPGNGVLSPDGERLAFVSEGSVWVVPVHGKVSPDIAGEPVRLTEPMGAWDVASLLAWSADGNWIAFNASDEKEDAIYVVRSSGGVPKKVPVEPRLRNSVYNYRLSLSPDGKVLAFSSRYIEKSEAEPPEVPGGLSTGVRGFFIYTIPVAGGKVKRLTDSASGEPAFSPDGKKIAFVKYYTSEKGELRANLWVVPAAGGTPIRVSDSDLQRKVGGPIWSPDGKMIAFTSKASSERKEICIVPVSETGKALASPTKIELPLGTYDMLAGWTPDNKVGVFLHNPDPWAIYTISASGGKPVQVTPSGWATHPQWSPDGERIYFRWNYGIASVPSHGGELSIVRDHRDSTFNLVYPGSGNAVSPDGKEIVFCDYNIHTVPIDGGEPKQITQGRFPCWSPDGKSIAFIRSHQKPTKRESGWNIYIIPSKGGDVRKLTSESDDVRRTHIDWSPDGKSIAYFAKDKTIRVVPVQGGEPRVVAKVEEVRNHDELAWSPDGSKLVYSSKGNIWVVSQDGGEPEEIETGLDAEAGHVSWSPDGKKLAFTAIKGGEEELYLMENFLPKSTAGE